MAKITKLINTSYFWLFKDKTGETVVIQWPNKPFALWISLKIFSRLFPNFHQVIISQVASASLIYWAYLELRQGDNNFRKILGASVLTFTVPSLIRSLV